MVIIHSETVKSTFKGTIIDIKTIEEFCRGYQDSREYQNLIPLIFGYINENRLVIYCSRIDCSKKVEPTQNFKDAVAQVIPKLMKPLYAFQCCFEQGVLYHSWGITINFDGELNKDKYEPKGDVVASLGIENYGDPFNDIGRRCKEALEKGDTESSIRHNRSCLLKERDILLRRAYRTPDDLILFNKKG
jgi:hypothetical protein